MNEVADLFDTADLIAAQVQTFAGFDTVRVVVNRDKDLDAEINAGVGQGEGAALLIDIVSGQPVEPGSLRLDHEFLLSIWTLPIIRDGANQPRGSTLFPRLVRGLNHWKPRPQSHPVARLEFTGWEKTPSENFSIYAATFRLPETL